MLFSVARVGLAAPLASRVAAINTHYWGPVYATVWISLANQVPAYLNAFPEAARNAAVFCLSLRLQRGALTSAAVAAAAWHCAFATAANTVLAALCQDRTLLGWYRAEGAAPPPPPHLLPPSAAGAPAAPAAAAPPHSHPRPLQLCPQALRGPRDALVALAERFADLVLPGEALLDPAAFSGIPLGVLAFSLLEGASMATTHVSSRMNAVCWACVAASLASKRVGGSAAALERLGARLAPATASPLSERLAAKPVPPGGADSEERILEAALECVGDIFPRALATAAFTLAPGPSGRMAAMAASSSSEAAKRALQSCLPRRVRLAKEDSSSASFLAVTSAATAASEDWSDGVGAFTEWAAAQREGLRAGRMVCARVAASRSDTLAFLLIALPRSSAAGAGSAGGSGGGGEAEAGGGGGGGAGALLSAPLFLYSLPPELRGLTDELAAALMLRRARRAAEASAAELMRAKTSSASFSRPPALA